MSNNSPSASSDGDLKSLGLNERVLRYILENIPIQIFVVDSECVFRYVNRMAASVFGKKTEEIIGKRHSDFVSAEDAQHFTCILKKIFQTAEIFSTDAPQHINGTNNYVKHRMVPLVNPAGSVMYVLGITWDVTDQMKAELALAESETRYKVIFENSPVSLWEEDFSDVKKYLVSTKGQIENLDEYFKEHPYELVQCAKLVKVVDVNLATVRMFKARSKQELLGLSLPKVLSDESYDVFRDELVALSNGKKSIEFEVVNKTLRDETLLLYMRFTTAPGHEDDLGRVLVSAVDISERKKAEQVLFAEKERLAVTLRSIGDGVITTDKYGRVDFINEVASKLTGYSSREAIGKDVGGLFRIIDENTRKSKKSPIAGLTENVENVDLSGRTVLLAKDDAEYNISFRVSPILDKNQAMNGVALVFRDMTASRRMESEIQRSEHLEALGILAGGIAHDFNNLLSGIFGYIDIARKLEPENSKAKECLDKTMTVFNQAKRLTQQLLTFSKGETPVKIVASLGSILSDSAAFATSGTNAQCKLNISTALWPCRIDVSQFTEVISNLIINASQAMPDGGTITISTENVTLAPENPLQLTSGNYVKIAIADTGHGIDPVNLSRIFDPFFTTKEKGSGLGLAIAYSVIKKHYGHITVDSALGKGTTFSIYLPAAADENTTSIERETGEIIRGQGKILIMDDEFFILDTASTILRILGYTAETAKNSTDALALFKNALDKGEPFAMVILDLTIPGGPGGKVVLKQMREIDPGVKAVVSSGYSDDPIIGDPRQFGFRAVLNKPYSVYEMSRIISRIISEK